MDQQEATADRAIRDVLMQDETAFNGGDYRASLNLYADDAVLMNPNRDTLIGKQATLQAYEGFAKIIAFDVSFEVQLIVQMGQEWAYARTTSRGTTTNRNTHEGSESETLHSQARRRSALAYRRLQLFKYESTPVTRLAAFEKD